MDFIKLLGTVFAVCYHPGSASKLFSGERICRRGTERPCYKIAYFQDSRLKVSFDTARQTCRSDGAELLSIETENEQRLVESFIQELRAADGDFWIGMQRSQRNKDNGIDCPSQYHWLDNSQATFRNWHWSEPSCGEELCALLYHRPSTTPGQGSRHMFKWNDDNCNTRNHFICKYSEEKPPVPTQAGNATCTDAPIISTMPKHPSVTNDYEKIKTGLSETSVSLSDDTMNAYYILLASIPILLLLLLVASVLFGFKAVARRRKEQTDSYPQPGHLASAGGAGGLGDEWRGADVEYTCPEIRKPPVRASSPDAQFDDYENVASDKDAACGFVTNDIYETCRSRGALEAGWVENEIYGY